jgi:hypothetical protein
MIAPSQCLRRFVRFSARGAVERKKEDRLRTKLSILLKAFAFLDVKARESFSTVDETVKKLLRELSRAFEADNFSNLYIKED